MSVTLACIQFKASDKKSNNLEHIKNLLLAATKQGAQLALFPEVSTGRFLKKDISEFAEELKGPTFSLLAPLAKTHQCAVVIGITEKYQSKIYNTLLFINEEGILKNFYRKINLFKYSKANIDESLLFSAGKNPVLIHWKGLKIGLSICFDLRFPDLFKTYRDHKVDLLLNASAFTYRTGQSDWDLLIRSRALDCSAYLIAANQFGEDIKGVKCYGNSAIVGPNGQFLKKACAEKETVLIAKIDTTLIESERLRFK